MDRDRAVQCLIADQLEKLERRSHSHWLLRVLENGFPGFGNMSESELTAELTRRGLKAEFEIPVEPVDEPDDDEDHDDDDGEIRAMQRAAARGAREPIHTGE